MRHDQTIVLLGCSYVGKTSILSRFTKNKFFEEYTETLGVNFYNRTCKTEHGEIIFELWDTSGDEMEFNCLPPHVCSSASAFFIILSYDSQDSLSTLKAYIEYAKKFFINDQSKKFTPIYIIINKKDIPLNERVFKIKDVYNCLDQSVNFNVIEVSAKKGKKIDFIFYSVITEIFGGTREGFVLSFIRNENAADNESDSNSEIDKINFDTLANPEKSALRVKLLDDHVQKKSKKCCCKG